MPFDPDEFLETPVATEPPYIPEGVKPPAEVPTAFDPDAFLSTPAPTYIKTKPEKQPGNYVTDILKGVARGTETAIGYAVGQPMIAMGSMGVQDIDKLEQSLGRPLDPRTKEMMMRQNENNRKMMESGEKIKQFFNKAAQTGIEAPQAGLPVSRRIASAVGESVPMMTAAIATTAATAGAGAPVWLAALSGASTFAPQAYGTHFDEQRAMGVDPDKAHKLALANMVAQVGLEAAIPLSGWLKGGHIMKRLVRGAFQEGGEEVLQQWSENSLRAIGYRPIEGKSFVEIAKQINEGSFEAGMAGAIMGGLMGSVNPPTIEEVKYDAKRRAAEIITRNADKEKMTPEQVQAEIARQHQLIDDHLTPKRYTEMQEKLKKGSVLGKGILESVIDVTAPTEGGGSVTAVVPGADLDPKVKVQATNLAVKALDRMKITPAGGQELTMNAIPYTFREIMISQIANRIQEGVDPTQVGIETESVIRQLLDENTIYLVGGGKTDSAGVITDPEFIVWYPKLRKQITLKELAALQAERPELRKLKILFSRSVKQKGINDSVLKTLNIEYNKALADRGLLQTPEGDKVPVEIAEQVAGVEVTIEQAEKLRRLHEHPARAKGLAQAFHSAVQGFFNDMWQLSEEYDAYSGYGAKKINQWEGYKEKVQDLLTRAEAAYNNGNLGEATALSEQALGYLHERFSDKVENLEVLATKAGLPKTTQPLTPAPEQAPVTPETPVQAPIPTPEEIEAPQITPSTEELKEAGIGPTVRSDLINNFVDTLRAFKEHMDFASYRAIIDNQVQELYNKLYPKKKGAKGLIFRLEEAEQTAARLQQQISDLRKSGENPEKLGQLVAQYNGLIEGYNSPSFLRNQIDKINKEIDKLSNIPVETNEAFANDFYRGELRQLYNQMSRSEKDFVIEQLRMQGLTDEQITDLTGETPNPSEETLAIEANSDLIEETNEAMIDDFEGKDIEIPPLVEGLGAVAEVSEEITLPSGKKLVPGKPYGIFPTDGGNVRMHDGTDLTLTRDELVELIQQAVRNPEMGITFDPYRDPRSLWKDKSVGAAEAGFAGQDYNQQKFLRGTPIELDERYGPRHFPMKIALEVTRFFKFQSQFMQFMEKWMGKEKLKRQFKQKPVTLQDEIITNVFADKYFRQYAAHIAWDQMQPVFQTIWKSIGEDLMSDPRFQALSGSEQKRAHQAKMTEVMKFLSDAHEEVFTKEGLLTPGGARLYELTDVGLGGAHFTTKEAEAFVDRLQYAAQKFGITDEELRVMYAIPPQVPVWDYLRVFRPETAFFKLIGHEKVVKNSVLPDLVLWVKGEIEYPMLERQLSQGVFKNANMWANIKKGYMHRGWALTEPQKRTMGRGAPGTLQAPSIEAAKYRTYQEFLAETGQWKTDEMALAGAELAPYDSYISNMQEYITDSLMNIQQLQTIEWLGTQLVPLSSHRKLRGFEDDAAVNQLIATSKLVEYKGSPTIQKLAQVTGLKEDAILQNLGYLQAKDEAALVKWYRGVFQQPYLYRPLWELLSSVYEAKNREGQPVTQANMIFNSIKRVLTVNPFDSTFLWMSAVIANNTPIESVTLIPKYLKAIYQGVTETGPKILQGKDWVTGDIENYENLPLFIKHGFTAINYEKAMQSLWDEQELGKYPEMMDLLERQKEYTLSVMGINAAIFNGMIAKELYHVLNKRYESFVRLGMDQETAARRAVKLINDTSFLLNPEVFGREGKYWTLALFTRNLTIGALRVASGAAYPVLKKTGLYKHRTSGMIGKTINSIVHGETSAADMNFLAKYYIAHIGKVLTAKVLIDSMIQYALSFVDPDNEDKPLDHEDRIMFFNEPGRRLSIKTPWKDNNQRRIFLDFQYLREAQWLGNVFARAFDGAVKAQEDKRNVAIGAGASALEYAGEWSTNRINTAGRWFANVMMNYDSKTGKQITYKDLPPELKADERFRWLMGQLVPLGFGASPTTENESIDNLLQAIEWFGGAQRYGEAAESEKLIPFKQRLERKRAIVDYFNRKVADKMTNMPLDEIPKKIGPAFTPEAAVRGMKKKLMPVQEYFKKNKAALWKSEALQ